MNRDRFLLSSTFLLSFRNIVPKSDPVLLFFEILETFREDIEIFREELETFRETLEAFRGSQEDC